MLIIHERYIENKLLQLVDLCSISNVCHDPLSLFLCVSFF